MLVAYVTILVIPLYISTLYVYGDWIIGFIPIYDIFLWLIHTITFLVQSFTHIYIGHILGFYSYIELSSINIVYFTFDHCMIPLFIWSYFKVSHFTFSFSWLIHVDYCVPVQYFHWFITLFTYLIFLFIQSYVS